MYLCILVQQFTSIEDLSSSGDDYKYPVPTKHEVISSLGVGGRWVTSQWDLQVMFLISYILGLKKSCLFPVTLP